MRDVAPEIEERSVYSPIKADRWSTGRVLLYLFYESEKDGGLLKMIAPKLTAHILSSAQQCLKSRHHSQTWTT